VLPLDLELKWRAIREQSALLPAALRKATYEAAYNDILDAWQDQWDTSAKGRWTYGFFPNIRNRLKTPIVTSHEMTQFLSGHGNFRAKLTYFNLQRDPICSCGQEDEDVDHVIFRCSAHSDHREPLIRAVMEAGYQWPCDRSVLVSSQQIFIRS